MVADCLQSRSALWKNQGIHDRFLVVDDSVWHFGDSFRSLGGALSMASKVRDMPLLLPMLLDAQAKAIPFAEYWARANHGVFARLTADASALGSIEAWFMEHEVDLALAFLRGQGDALRSRGRA